jgi:hypothetical protein
MVDSTSKAKTVYYVFRDPYFRCESSLRLDKKENQEASEDVDSK